MKKKVEVFKYDESLIKADFAQWKFDRGASRAERLFTTYELEDERWEAINDLLDAAERAENGAKVIFVGKERKKAKKPTYRKR